MVDEVVDEDVGVDATLRDVPSLEGVDKVREDRLEAGGKRSGQAFVWGVEEGDGADVVKGGDGVYLFGDEGKEARGESGVR